MKLARWGAKGHERPVVEIDGTWRDASSITSDFDPAFFAGGGVQRLRDQGAELPEVPSGAGDAAERIGAPIAKPGTIICVGMNYAAHAAESGAEPPKQPVIFLKTAQTLAGPGDTVTIPRRSEKTDWEVELAVVIGQRLSYVDDPSVALTHVAGYALADDVSERAFQLEESGGQWSKGKCCDGFTPLGPWLVTPDEVDPSDLRLRSSVNGEPRQDSRTADMIFDVGTILTHLSQYLVLEPGDLVLTGTPEGVALSGRFPYLRPGDIVEVEIDGLGRARHAFAAWEDPR